MTGGWESEHPFRSWFVKHPHLTYFFGRNPPSASPTPPLATHPKGGKKRACICNTFPIATCRLSLSIYVHTLKDHLALKVFTHVPEHPFLPTFVHITHPPDDCVIFPPYPKGDTKRAPACADALWRIIIRIRLSEDRFSFFNESVEVLS